MPFSPLFWLGGFPTKIDYRKKVGTLNPNLEDLVVLGSETRFSSAESRSPAVPAFATTTPSA